MFAWSLLHFWVSAYLAFAAVRFAEAAEKKVVRWNISGFYFLNQIIRTDANVNPTLFTLIGFTVVHLLGFKFNSH